MLLFELGAGYFARKPGLAWLQLERRMGGLVWFAREVRPGKQ